MKTIDKTTGEYGCVCGFRTDDKSKISSHVRIMDGVYGVKHYEVK